MLEDSDIGEEDTLRPPPYDPHAAATRIRRELFSHAYEGKCLGFIFSVWVSHPDVAPLVSNYVRLCGQEKTGQLLGALRGYYWESSY